MDLTYVDIKKMNSLEHYAMSLMTGMLSLKTLENFHIRAIDLGLMPEDMMCQANTMVWDIRRLLKIYQNQMECALELIGGDFDVNGILTHLRKDNATQRKRSAKKSKIENVCNPTQQDI